MANFDQPAASRQAIHDAAVKHLRSSSVVSALAGTSDKKSKAYRNAARRMQLLTAAPDKKQRRKATPGKLAGVGKTKINLKADYTVFSSTDDTRENKDMYSEVPPDFFALALSDPDAAWDMFLEQNNYPYGEVANVHDISFK